MAPLTDYHAKFARDAARTPFGSLPERERTFIRDRALHYRFTQQELRQIVDMALNGSDIRDTARVLKISPTTVIVIFRIQWR